MARRGKKISLSLLAAVVFLLFPNRLNAQSREQVDDALFNTLDSRFIHMPSRSAEAMPGAVEIIEAQSEYSHDFKLFDKLPVTLSLDAQYVGIEETVPLELPSHLTGLSLGLETTLPFFNFEDTYLRLGLAPSFYGDDWNFPSSAFRLPSRFLVIHVLDEKWTFLAGVAVYPDFENEVLPVWGFIYKPNEKLTFNIVPKRPGITYRVNERLLLFGEAGGFLNSEFEVSRGESKNVVLRYKQTRLGAGIKFRVNKFIEASFSAGTVFNRSLKYRDDQGKLVIKDGLYSQARTQIRF